jgi:hypothetical protein
MQIIVLLDSPCSIDLLQVVPVGMYLTGVHFMGAYLTGAYLTSAYYLMDVSITTPLAPLRQSRTRTRELLSPTLEYSHHK